MAQLLREKPVIFISAHPEYAIQAFDLDAVDFIKKPVTRERLEKALLKVRSGLSRPAAKTYFTWNTHMGKSTVYMDEILYITTSDAVSYTHLHGHPGKSQEQAGDADKMFQGKSKD